MPDTKPLAEKDNIVYDRQIRIFGHTGQKALIGATCLIFGSDSIEFEIAKNLVCLGPSVKIFSLGEKVEPYDQLIFMNADYSMSKGELLMMWLNRIGTDEKASLYEPKQPVADCFSVIIFSVNNFLKYTSEIHSLIQNGSKTKCVTYYRRGSDIYICYFPVLLKSTIEEISQIRDPDLLCDLYVEEAAIIGGLVCQYIQNAIINDTYIKKTNLRYNMDNQCVKDIS